MSKPLTQIGDEVREMTDEEYAEYQQLQKEIEAENIALAEKMALRSAALAKLGLTTEEITALFG